MKKSLLIVVLLYFVNLLTFGQDLYKFRDGSKEGFINSSGKQVIEPIYDDVDDFHEGLAKVKIKDNFGYINSSGKLIISANYIRGTEFREGLAAVKDDSGWHYTDKQGNVVFNEICNYAYGNS